MAPVKVGVVLHKFEHVDGAQVCASLYPHYTLPDGTTVHYYHHDNLFDNNIVRPGRITHELGPVLLLYTHRVPVSVHVCLRVAA